MEPTPIGRELVSRIKQEVPRSPGVYLFQDRFGAIIYIGKSVNLKRRMCGYFGRNVTRFDGRMKRMVHSIRDFNFLATDSDLSALLVEDELIKRHLPYFNRRQKKFGNYRYLELTQDPFPCLKIVEQPGGLDRSRFFGPFPDIHFIGRLLAVVQRCFALRACTDPAPSRECLNHQIARCMGPCQGLIEPLDYDKIVKGVEAFLNGDAGLAEDALRRDMDRCAGSLEFERAAHLKESLEFCRRFSKRQRFTHAFRTRRLMIRRKNLKEPAYLFEEGCRILEPDDRRSRKSERAVKESAVGITRKAEDDRFLLDRANIVYHWLRRNRDRFEHHFE
ncbi:MAG: excinuclease ABC subunit UvrC [Planctomycetota bacterium]|jgi:excinuclease ABC subunit C